MTARRRAACVLAVVVGLVLVGPGCAEGDPGADGDVESLGELVPSPTSVELTEAGTCPDGTAWASDADRSSVVRIARTAGGGLEPGAVRLPSDAVAVEATPGGDPCAAADGASPATRGRLEVRCDGPDATLRLDGLVVEDGTTFAPGSDLGAPGACAG